MSRTRNTPFTAVCARLGVPTGDGRVLMPSKVNASILEETRDIPVLIRARDGREYNAGCVDQVEVFGSEVLVYGHLYPDPKLHWYVTALRAGDVHMNPDIDSMDMEHTAEGLIRFWSYRLLALTVAGRSAWSDLPYVRVRLW